ncbi:beta-galactosidase [Alkalihalobacterium bogoriense]|uniref:beta-galactosidase n=1 Tax=Alkalihalobacterium bogoriense TaxID=246272 RepID=UPI000559675A|nr:beta-galactosidase [Alkalihalobacterium bogoriense]
MKSVSEVLPYMTYGGDYNPEQWSEDVWLEDARLMKKAGVNLVSVGIFSWGVLERNEGEFDFQWLDKVLDILHDHGVGVSLATATASTPAWLSKKYPDSIAIDKHGVPYSFGSRQHYSPTSPDYIRLVKILVRKLAERYKNHPALKMWHINNEYACHLSECYSANTEKAFRQWLKDRYETIEVLNEKWGTNFWSQRYNDFDEIMLLNNPPTFANPGQELDYKRFMDEAYLQLYITEKEILREVTPEVPVFTNFMFNFKPLNYFKWAKELDVVTWDSYPDPREGIPVSHAMNHDIMRSLKQGQPFLLMEQVTSQVNWMDINVIKPPGVMRTLSYSTVGRGGDGILFFQWRQGRAGAEKFHGAMVPHSNDENSRVYKEVVQLGQELKQLETVVGARTDAKVAILFDWENWWAVELGCKPHNKLKYIDRVKLYYQEFFEQNIAVDFRQASDDLSGYQFVVAPMLYMVKEGDKENLEKFVTNGGTLLVTYFSGIADENDRIYLGGYPGPLRKLLGIYVEEFDPYPEGKSNTLRYNGQSAPCYIWSDIIHLEGAEQIASFGENWYKEKPAVTKHAYGKGHAYYIGTEPDRAFLTPFIEQITTELHIQAPLKAPPRVEVLQRNTAEHNHIFIINHNDADVTISLQENVEYEELITGERVSKQLKVNAVDVAILKY